MTTKPTIRTKSEYRSAQKRIKAVMGRTDFTDEEVSEYRALAKAIGAYADEHIAPKNVKLEPAVYFDVRLDMGESTLDELLPLFGGMDGFIEFMTRRRRLSEEMINTLTTELGIKRGHIDGPFTEPVGWDMIEECTDGRDWRAEMIAHRDAKAAVAEAEAEAEATERDAQDRRGDVATREPDLAAAL